MMSAGTLCGEFMPKKSSISDTRMTGQSKSPYAPKRQIKTKFKPVAPTPAEGDEDHPTVKWLRDTHGYRGKTRVIDGTNVGVAMNVCSDVDKEVLRALPDDLKAKAKLKGG